MQGFEVGKKAIAQVRDARLAQLDTTVLAQLRVDFRALLASQVAGEAHVHDDILTIALRGLGAARARRAPERGTGYMPVSRSSRRAISSRRRLRGSSGNIVDSQVW